MLNGWVGEKTVRPPNSLVLVGDPKGEPPKSMSGGLVAATDSLVAVGTLSVHDGATRVSLIGSAETATDCPSLLAFDGVLEIQSAVLAITNVYGETIVETPISSSSAHIRVWVNHPSEPDEICIVVLE